MCIWVGWLNACSPDGCWWHQANKMSIVAQTWLISIAFGFPWGTQEMVTPEGQCNIDFQIWIDTVFKSTPGECNLFPLQGLLKPLARNQDPILVPFLTIYHSLGILLIWLFTAFLSPVEVKLHADKDPVCLSCLPLYSWCLRKCLALSLDYPCWKNMLVLGHQKDKQKREQRMEEGSATVTSAKKLGKRTFYFRMRAKCWGFVYI